MRNLQVSRKGLRSLAPPCSLPTASKSKRPAGGRRTLWGKSLSLNSAACDIDDERNGMKSNCCGGIFDVGNQCKAKVTEMPYGDLIFQATHWVGLSIHGQRIHAILSQYVTVFDTCRLCSGTKMVWSQTRVTSRTCTLVRNTYHSSRTDTLRRNNVI
jgi:hypothetical protein